jgi:hypothetical protein
MWLRWNDITRFNNDTGYRFMGGKRATAINVLALMITFFRRFSQITAGASVRHATAQWTMHHRNPLFDKNVK